MTNLPSIQCGSGDEILTTPKSGDVDHLKSPFPWFGGKRKIAGVVWERFGEVKNYVEPFFGSGSVLLSRPNAPGTETVNDLDGFVANFWRALQSDPDAVAFHAAWPVNECDLHARHAWLVGQKTSMQSRLEGDPEWFDAKVAGWWCWGTAVWIGSGFCSGKGPWKVQDIDGVRQLVHVGDGGQGTERKRPSVDWGRGVKRNRPHLRNGGQGVNGKRKKDSLLEYMQELADRMRRVRVCCGDWSRVVGQTVTYRQGLTAVFLDPPYADTAGRDKRLYRVDSLSVAHNVREWAVAEGLNPLMRIALCGYEGEHVMPDDWECCSWNAGSGFGGQAKDGASENGKKERVWFSPHCLTPQQKGLL